MTVLLVCRGDGSTSNELDAAWGLWVQEPRSTAEGPELKPRRAHAHLPPSEVAPALPCLPHASAVAMTIVIADNA